MFRSNLCGGMSRCFKLRRPPFDFARDQVPVVIPQDAVFLGKILRGRLLEVRIPRCSKFTLFLTMSIFASVSLHGVSQYADLT